MMKRLRLIFLFFFVTHAIVSCQSGSGREKVSHIDSAGYIPPAAEPIPEELLKKYQDGIEDFYQKFLVRSGFNGGILVAKNGQIIFEKYRGYYNLHTKDSLTSRSAFHLASISKTFTAMAILKLVEDGKVKLTDSVQTWFPRFPYEGVTVKTLLNHRSALPNYMYFMDKLGWPKDTLCSNEDILNYLIEFKPPGSGRADTHFQYCNTNYSLLALIIEKASGLTYEQYLRTQFFIPLGMNDTYVFDAARDTGRAMPSYDYRGRPEALTYLDRGYGDKNIYSTPQDLFKWDQALYSDYFFSKEVLQEAFTPYSNEKKGIRNYGLGWRMNVYPDGRKIVYHNGWWHGNNTVFIRDIQHSLTIIVLGNKYNRNIYKAGKIAELFEHGAEIESE